jgi:hypothetical protein
MLSAKGRLTSVRVADTRGNILLRAATNIFNVLSSLETNGYLITISYYLDNMIRVFMIMHGMIMLSR